MLSANARRLCTSLVAAWLAGLFRSTTSFSRVVAEGDMTLSSDEVVACDGSTAAGCAGLFPSVSPVCCRAITRPGSAWVCLNQEMAFCASGSNPLLNIVVWQRIIKSILVRQE